ncbi:ABC-F family ATP-binding cassette domain-containing protein [Shouchella shacheensis]|uniref:ABC-F family ATP-binding cassette domain-containing protein n=1 Tax=Shouchella shacheensis TaxID=1649580 RepID=UPI00073FB850|nr:ABC-F family ATP-binding cassette domain-containing protein [Shouchella shacheensis]
MSVLRVESLSKAYGEKPLFQDIHFTIERGQRIGLLGVNGTGKSTLVKVLAGIEGSDSGTQYHAKDFQVEFLPQQPELPDGETVLGYIYNGDSEVMTTLREYERAQAALEEKPESERLQQELLVMQERMDKADAWEASTQAKTILTKLGIYTMTATLGELSGGQKKRVAIARALIQPADLLLLDEPTNHLDHATVAWLEAHISAYPGALIVITHDRYFLNRVTNRIYELDRGALHVYEGNFETYLQAKADREMQEEVAEEKRQNVLRRELAWLKRGAKARSTKQKARIQRVETLDEQGGPEAKQQLDVAICSKRLGKQVIELSEITKAFHGKTLIDSLSYLIVPGERLGIIGENGSGKSTLLNIMAGRLQPDRGTISVGETVKIGYYTQGDAELDGKLRVVDYIKEVAEVVYTVEGDVITAEQMLERFMFPRSHQWTYIRRLSGGEKRRLYLLRILMGEPNVLFLDEPTNDLDIETLTVLENYLDSFPGVVVTVSHDRYFLDRAVDQMLIFQGDGTISRYQGAYTDFLEQEGQKQAKSEAMKAKPEPPKRKKEGKKLSYMEQREWEQIDDKIAALEEKQQSLEGSIAEAGSAYGKITELMNEKEQIDERLEEALDRWTELAEKVEEL